MCYYHFSYVCDSLTEDVGISSSQRHLCHIQNRHGFTKDNDDEEEKNKTKFEQNSTLWKLLSLRFPSLWPNAVVSAVIVLGRDHFLYL